MVTEEALDKLRGEFESKIEWGGKEGSVWLGGVLLLEQNWRDKWLCCCISMRHSLGSVLKLGHADGGA